MPPPTAAARTNRLLIALLLTTSAIAWFALWRWGASPYGHAIHLHQDSGGAGATWPGFGLFVTGWTLMIVAMMLPTIAPLVVMLARAVEGRANRIELIALLIAGYLLVWILAGFGAYMAALAIRGLTFAIAADRATWVIGAGALIVAGLYQFSALKDRCLEHCRSPFSFMMERWSSEGLKEQAVSLGVRHGFFCVGCCWTLMLLMLPLGASNLAWMLLIGVVMAAEKNAPWGSRLSKPVGGLLLVLAAVVIVRGRAF
jgi:predicted metal-binding membrane protein